MSRKLVLVALAALGCTSAPIVRSGAGEDGTYAMASDVDPRNEARRALERDARRRETAMLDVLEPGRALASTRLTDEEVAAGLVPPRELFGIGGELFHHTFLPEESGVATLARFGGTGAPPARRCAACHTRGIAGSGTSVDVAYEEGDGEQASSAVVRRPRSLAGAAWIELAARATTAELAALRDATIALARQRGGDVTSQLTTRAGLSFGRLTAHADGSLDTTALAGLDADLVVRPFGARGEHASLREAVESELGARLGLTVGEAPAPLAETQRTALVTYLALLAPPIEEPPSDPDFALASATGRERFVALGCAGCHVPEIEIPSTRLDVGSGVTVDLATDGESPRLAPPPSDGAWIVRAYTDLRRHAMGAALADPRAVDAHETDAFVTPPLWGCASAAPYLHDGRAGSIEDAILAHGGEAQAARDAYDALGYTERGELRLFLATLVRARRLEVR
ncbi:MAG: di-heme oxidoredictase family protein [Sandaracinus sp.]